MRSMLPWCMLTVLSVLLVAPSVRAQAVRVRILDKLEVQEIQDEGGAWLLRVRFAIPVRYVRHSPLERGDLLVIDLAPLAVPDDDLVPALRRESLNVPASSNLGLSELSYEGDGLAPSLVLRFEGERAFQVRQGADFRSIDIRVEDPLSVLKSTPLPSGSSRLLQEARRAMTLGELDRAVAICEVIRESGAADAASQRDALELLGLARQRKGQLAHARAEYEAYLERYPDEEGASRVRQRLRSLETAGAAPRPTLRSVQPRDGTGHFDVFGSAATSYLHGQELVAEVGDAIYGSSLLSDLSVNVQYETERFEVLGELASSYRYDFVDHEHEPRVSRLLVELYDRVGWSATLGRQSRSNGGVLGRFDGMRLAADVGQRMELSALFGFPLESTTSTKISVNRQLFGAAFDFRELLAGLDGQLYVIARRVDGYLDRVGVGGELRYSTDSYFGLAFLDVDASFGSVNTFLLTGTYRFGRGAELHAQIDTRNGPILALENALQGQTAGDLDELGQSFSVGEMRKLARDRTTRTYRASVGASRPFREDFLLGADLGVSLAEGTPGSGGVPATRGTGPELAASVFLTRSDLLMRGGIGSVEIRSFVGDVYQSYGVHLTGRIPIDRNLRVQPRFSASYRRQDAGRGRFDLLSTLRVGLLLYGFDVDAELGLDWSRSFGPLGEDELGLLAEIVLRYDF